MTDITELTSVQKNANIHRLSRLIAYAPNDELRQMAVEVELYTDRLIEALEKAQGMEAYWKTQCRGITDHCEELQQRIAELGSRTVNIKFAPIQVEELGNVRDGKKHPYMFGAGYNSAVIHCESVIQQELDAKGIKWEAE
ncbi:hypothetical protein LVU62_00290 [Klebsiella variicola subsp. variicola]|uniref:hypothetical protein n=1 Tax=Klebsiella variicola TaxID=244366 RepID=UPI001E338F5C|nr:hypothetical protein [Klebsiella variicola]MCE0291256.1 hypothetical protein [Klebsiella variicola subsp. variicola]